MSAFGGGRNLQPKPPEKGVFPLDHFGECAQVCQTLEGELWEGVVVGDGDVFNMLETQPTRFDGMHRAFQNLLTMQNGQV